jgi:[protein-PII] uridylyltransferase
MAFASHFPSLTLLNMIYILTYADMSGVGGEIYNSFSAKLLLTLYNQSLEALAHPKLLNEAQKRAKKELSLSRNEQFKLLKKSQQKKIFQIPSNLIFLRYKTQRILDISLKGFQTQDYSYHISNEKYLTLEIIRKDNFNLGYLLAKLAQLDLVNMDICKLFDGLKYFKIDFSQSIDTEEIPRLEHIIDQAFKQKSTQTDYSVKIKKEEIDIDCSHSKTYALMQLNASNQKGLLAFVIDMFDTLGIDIVTAKIHTLKNRARDMFLIEKNGNFCKNVPFIIEKLSI